MSDDRECDNSNKPAKPGPQADSLQRLAYPKSARVLKQADFDRAHQSNIFAADDTLVIKANLNSLGHCRLGMSVSKKVGNAVVRNRWKRRIREAFRLQQDELPRGFDLVVRPRKGAVCDYHQICKSLKFLSKKIERRVKKSQSKRMENRSDPGDRQ